MMRVNHNSYWKFHTETKGAFDTEMESRWNATVNPIEEAQVFFLRLKHTKHSPYFQTPP